MEAPERTYLARVASRYKSLFTLPGYWLTMILILLISSTGSATAFAIAYQSWEKALEGLIFSLQVLILPIMATDFVLSLFMKGDVIFDRRRIAGLSLFVCVALVVSMNVGAVIQAVLKKPSLDYAAVFAVCLAVSIRHLVFTTVSQLKSWQLGFATSLQPLAYFLSLLSFQNLWQPLVFSAVFASSTILVVSSYVFVYLINRKGEQAIGIGAISLFKAFLANWIGNATRPLEEHFEKLGLNSNVSVSLLAFRKERSLEAVMIVPMIHPGPFKNLGSSNLPYLIQRSLEEHFGIVAAIPHGTCGHESNLTSQQQCGKVLEEILDLARFSEFESKATRFVREEKNLAKASCQIFGDVALVTVTRAPASMEDVPREVGFKIIEQGRKLGAKDVIVVDAHNSLGSSKELAVLSNEELQDIVLAAGKALQKALKEERLPFKIGTAKAYTKEFGIREGIGLGGAVALTVVVGEQKVAYVTIDGNNMVKGLREEILKSLEDVIHDGEILTTDTHVVNAVLSIDRGYYPVGEAVDKEKLISYIKEGVFRALTDVSNSEVSYRIAEIRGVKILSEERLRSLNILIDSTYEFAKKLAPMIYVPSLVAASLFFMIILFSWVA